MRTELTEHTKDVLRGRSAVFTGLSASDRYDFMRLWAVRHYEIQGGRGGGVG